MRIQNEALTLDGTDMESDILSNAIWLGHIAHYSIQMVFTGSPNGTFKLQASNDEGGKDGGGLASPTIVNWTDIADSDQAITASGDHTWTVENAGYRWVRVVWTDSSSGSPSTITSARFNVKGV